MKRQVTTQINSYEESSLLTSGDITLRSCTETSKRLLDQSNVPGVPPGNPCLSSNEESEVLVSRGDKMLGSVYIGATYENGSKKKAKKNQWSQLTLKSFFRKSPIHSNSMDKSRDSSTNQADIVEASQKSDDPPIGNDQSELLSQGDTPQLYELSSSVLSHDQDEPNTCSSEKKSVALQEWQRIQQMMQNSIPLCKGHKEPCVARVVKKQGPNLGRRFYVCARAEVIIFGIQLSLRLLMQLLFPSAKKEKPKSQNFWLYLNG